jgi:prolipoprotein diacylglyceryltransferase
MFDLAAEFTYKVPSPPSFFLEFFSSFLVWGVLALLNFWVWSKSKSQGNLLMCAGAAVAALAGLIGAISTPDGKFGMFWFPWIGHVLFAAGFYLSVKPMVAAQLAELKKKATDLAKPGTDEPKA